MNQPSVCTNCNPVSEGQLTVNTWTELRPAACIQGPACIQDMASIGQRDIVW